MQTTCNTNVFIFRTEIAHHTFFFVLTWTGVWCWVFFRTPLPPLPARVSSLGNQGRVQHALLSWGGLGRLCGRLPHLYRFVLFCAASVSGRGTNRVARAVSVTRSYVANLLTLAGRTVWSAGARQCRETLVVTVLGWRVYLQYVARSALCYVGGG